VKVNGVRGNGTQRTEHFHVADRPKPEGGKKTPGTVVEKASKNAEFRRQASETLLKGKRKGRAGVALNIHPSKKNWGRAFGKKGNARCFTSPWVAHGGEG